MPARVFVVGVFGGEVAASCSVVAGSFCGAVEVPDLSDLSDFSDIAAQ